MPHPANTFSLVADIGGTNTRCALADGARVLPDTVRRYTNAEYAGLEQVLRQFILDEGNVDTVAACVAVAGPVRDGRGTLTNLDWAIDTDTLARATKATTVAILNDLQAQGHALSSLNEGALRPIIPASAPHAPDAVRLVVGVGTGFNAAPVFQTQSGEFVPPSAQDIMAACATKTDPRAPEAAALFSHILGTVCGNLALTQLPFGGVYLVGGVARALAPYLGTNGFADTFRNKGRFSEFMSNFAVSVVEDDYAALIGSASHLEALKLI